MKNSKNFKSFNFYIERGDIKYYHDFITTFVSVLGENCSNNILDIQNSIKLNNVDESEITDINSIGVNLIMILKHIFDDSIVFEKDSKYLDFGDVENVNKYKVFGESHCVSYIDQSSINLRDELFNDMLSEIYRTTKYLNVDIDINTENGELEFLIHNRSVTGKIFYEGEIIFEYLAYLDSSPLDGALNNLTSIIETYVQIENKRMENENVE